MSWDKEYKRDDALWGKGPDSGLVSFEYFIPKGRVLDLGGGSGRNSFHFAEMGCDVDLVENSKEGIDICQKYLTLNKKLQVSLYHQDIEDFIIEENVYSLIILSNVLQFFDAKSSRQVINRCKLGLAENGAIFINTFSDKDPLRKKLSISDSTEEIEPRTFLNHSGDWRMRFFTKEELLDFLSNLKLIYFSEVHWLDSGHGEPHYHHSLEALHVKKIG